MKKVNPIAMAVRTPLYKVRTVKAKKGKGSYSRKKNKLSGSFFPLVYKELLVYN